jgi:hypothetical protein
LYASLYTSFGIVKSCNFAGDMVGTLEPRALILFTGDVVGDWNLGCRKLPGAADRGWGRNGVLLLCRVVAKVVFYAVLLGCLVVFFAG